MDDATAREIMARFAKAYFARDGQQLQGVITPNAEWLFAFGADAPDGRMRRGVDGFMQGIRENDALFERLRFEDVSIRAIGNDQILMTYLAIGKYRSGTEFQLRGIELIRVEDGRLATKDVFLKQYREDEPGWRFRS